MDKCIKKHFCAVWRAGEKSKNLVGRIRVKYVLVSFTFWYRFILSVVTFGFKDFADQHVLLLIFLLQSLSNGGT